MFHPLIRLLATQPELLAHHLGAYAHLAGVQLGQARGQLQRRALLLAGLAGGLALGGGLGGVAALLAAALPLGAMPAPWLLLAVPALPLALAAACALVLQQQPHLWSGALLRAQLAADATLLAEAAAP